MTEFRKRKVNELVRVYQDLEKTLKALRENCERNLGLDSSLRHINVRKLIVQLSRSKKHLERKIGNTILLEKQQFKKRIKAFASGFRHRNA